MLSSWLKDYEARQPENVVKVVIDMYIKDGKFCEMRDNAGLKLSTYETSDTAKAFFNSFIKGKDITFASVSKRAEGSDLGFGLSADGEKFMNVYLKKTVDGGYKIFSAEFEDAIYKTIKITTPSNAEISVNGKQLELDARIDLANPAISSSYFNDNIINKQYAIIDDLIYGKPNVTTVDDFTVSADNDGLYAITLSTKDPDAAAIEAFALEAAKVCSSYLQKDESLAKLQQYLATDTKYYKNISTSYITYVAAHTGFRFDDIEVSELHKFTDNLYACRVKMTHVIISANGYEHNDYFDKYVYVYKTSNGLKAVDMQIYGG